MDKIIFTNDNILMHGPGGTGKTFVLKQLITHFADDGETKFVYLAPTGTAASNINGTTIHSYFGLRPFVESGDTENDIKLAIDTSTYRPDRLDVLIIDEISMVGVKLISVIDGILRKSYNVKKIMGGVRCIFSGDFYQLPPVKDKHCYKWSSWNELDLQLITFTEQKRYTCNKTFEMLMRLRKNQLTPEDRKWLLSRRTAYLNGEHKSLPVQPIQLFTSRDAVKNLNDKKMRELESPLFTHTCENVLKTKSKRVNLSPRQQDKYLEDIVDKTCELKVGAQVMLYRNYDIQQCLTNGRLGIVMEIDQKRLAVKVKFSTGLIHEISARQYEISGQGWTLSRTQIPLRPAWAITNYKCQGMTLDYAIVDLDRCFAEGQVYTTVARVVSLEHLYIMSIDFRKIKVADYVE